VKNYIYVCDLCENTSTNDEYQSQFVGFIPGEKPFDMPASAMISSEKLGNPKIKHFCPDCVDDLGCWVTKTKKNAPKKKTVAKKAPPKKKAIRKKKPVYDTGFHGITK